MRFHDKKFILQSRVDVVILLKFISIKQTIRFFLTKGKFCDSLLNRAAESKNKLKDEWNLFHSSFYFTSNEVSHHEYS